MSAPGGTPVRRPVSLNLNVRGLGHSATLAIKARCRAVREAKADRSSISVSGSRRFPFPARRRGTAPVRG